MVVLWCGTRLYNFPPLFTFKRRGLQARLLLPKQDYQATTQEELLWLLELGFGRSQSLPLPPTTPPPLKSSLTKMKYGSRTKRSRTKHWDWEGTKSPTRLYHPKDTRPFLILVTLFTIEIRVFGQDLPMSKLMPPLKRPCIS